MSLTQLFKHRLVRLGIIVAVLSCLLFLADAAPNPTRAQDPTEDDSVSPLWLPLITRNWTNVQGPEPEPFISPPVEPYSGPVDPELLEPAPSGPIKTVPEGVLPTLPPPPRAPIPDPVIQMVTEDASALEIGAVGLISDPDVNVPGITSFANPPDPVGDVGPNHFVQMTNAPAAGGQTVYQIFDKDGASMGGPFRFGGLWPVGDLCDSDWGDPIVVYDHLADRWLLSQFAAAASDAAGNPLAPFGECIAISQTPDPLGGVDGVQNNGDEWFLYTFDVQEFPDYPKFGVWPDGYYMSSNESSLGIYVFDRANMLLGNAARYIRDAIPALGTASVRATRILPADLDGPPPPAGMPNYFMRTVDNQQNPGTSDRIEVYAAQVDWLTPSFSFTLVDTLNPAPFQIMLCDRTNQGAANPNRTRDCIPQPDTAQNVDALSNRPMMQLKYRNFGTHASMVFNQTIDVSGSIFPTLGFTPTNEVAGIRWYELRKSGANWTIHQQGTYAPQPIGADAEDELLHRWMGSAAMDKDGNIALGYSIVNDDDTNGQEVYPGIRYTGRRFDDVLGLMPQGEKIITNGVNSVLGNNSQTTGDGRYRWGDYSALSVDPVDDCTFWYTQHVAGMGGMGAKPTQIASFRFDTCGTDLAISKDADPDPTTAGEQLSYDITVVNNGSNTAINVAVTDTLPLDVIYNTDTDTCTFSAGTGSGGEDQLFCDLGDIPAGAEHSFTIQVTIDPDLVAIAGGPTSITNIATVSHDRHDPDLSNNTATASTIVNEEADLRVTKECKPDQSVQAGDEATCTITIENLGPSTARNVTALDAHLSNGTFTFGVITPGSCTATPNPQVGSGVVTCNLGDLAAGDSIIVKVPVSADGPYDINDQVTVSSDTPDPDPGNNQAADAVSVRTVSDLSLTKSDSPDPVVAGDILTYNLTVTNNGPSTAINVVIEDVLPSGVRIDSVSASGGSCNAGVPGNASLPTTCAFGSLANGASETMTIVVTVLPDASGILHNSAQASSDNLDLDNSNNLASAYTVVTAAADLAVAKSDNPDPAVAGGQLTYEVTVANNGPSTARDVELMDTLPAEVSFIGARVSNGTGTCVLLEVPPDTVLCDLNDLNAGGGVTVFIDVRVDPSVPNGTSISNTATVSSSTADPDGTNNSATEETTVNAEADLEILKDGNVDTTNPSTTIVYTIDVINHGGSDAQNVVVVDTLPEDPKKVVYVFDTGNGACSYHESTHSVTCDFGTLAAGDSLTVKIYVQARGSLGVITNTVEVTATTVDPDTSNNTARKDLLVHGGSDRPGDPKE